jgi:hypothetical protein
MNPFNWFKPKDFQSEILEGKLNNLLADKMMEENDPSPVFPSNQPTSEEDIKFVLTLEDVQEIVELTIEHCKENL